MAENPELREWPQTRVEWRIEHFTDVSMEVGFCLTSPPFFLSDTKWYLRFYPNGEANDNPNKEEVCLFLRKEESTKEYLVKFTMGIKKADGTMFIHRYLEYLFKIEAAGKGYSNFMKRFDLNQRIASDDSLTIFCIAAIVDKSLIPSAKEVASQTSLPPPETTEVLEAASQTIFLDDISILSEDFKDMYISKRCSDVTIFVRDKEFFAHRCVLAARSTVFASMFQHEMGEKISGKVEISDCDPSSFDEFLLFLYTGRFADVPSTKAVNLYKTANKYSVKQLKEKCVFIMRRNLCVDSFCDVLHLATLHFESDLLKAATDFFIQNVETILPTTKWIQFSEENFVISNELFMKFVESKKIVAE